MKVSIVTINYNDQSGLRKTIESVAFQTYKGCEHIIIDGGSTDGSLNIIKEFATHVAYWVSEKDRGVYHAMNKGILAANGEYIFFLNSGDTFYSNDVVERFVSYSHKYPLVDILYGNVVDIHENGEKIRRGRQYLSKITLYNKMICHQAIFAKREIFLANGLFDEQYKIKADYEWLMRNLFKNATHKYVNLDIAFYALGGLSTTGYKTISVHEIPKVRALYFNPKMERLAWFFINRKILKVFSWHLNSKFCLKVIDSIIMLRR